MNIFMLTSVPLNPPWDQGDKNLAYSLTQALPAHRFLVLTQRGGALPPGMNLERLPLYQRRNPSLGEKAGVLQHLLFSPSGLFQAAAAGQWGAESSIPVPSNGRNQTSLTPLRIGRLLRAPASKPDLYHLIYQPTPLSAALSRHIPEFKRRPTLHTVPAVSQDGDVSRALFFADRLVALSRNAKGALERLGLENVTYIPSGVDVAHWAALRPQKNRLKERLDLAGRPVILYPGHYGRGYGADVLLRALPQIVASAPQVAVLWACRSRSPHDQKREQETRQAITQRGLDANVRFFNTVADMRALIGASDLTVLPLETLRNKVDIPTTLLESLAAGVPIVISDLAPMNELVERSDNMSPLRSGDFAFSEAGLLIPPGDAPALAQAVIALLNNREQWADMADGGQALVWGRYDLRQVAAQYDRLYQEMAA